MVKITIDNQAIEVEEDVTLLHAAKKIGIEIPTLCYHEALSPYGACRVCLVEIQYSGRSKIVTSCTYPAWEGLVVKTDSDKVKKARKFQVELLLARCPNVKEIRELADSMGVEGNRLNAADDDCILCGLCVRVCKDIIGKAAISFVGRGVDRKVESPFEINSEDCIGCGACASVCPTGAIKLEDIEGKRKMHRCHTELELVKCKSCGNPFVPVKGLETIKAKIELPEDIFLLCHKCKRKKIRTQIGEIRVKYSSAI